MVYIYAKNTGGKIYYYLRASVRQGKRVVSKDIAYLGDSIEAVKKKLNELPQKNIRKSYKTIQQFLESNTYLEQAKKRKLRKDEFLNDQLTTVEACKLHFTKKFLEENKLTQQETYKNFVIEFSFNTAAIEGNTITLNEARNLLQEGLTPKDKTLREIYDIQNTEQAFIELLTSKRKITPKLIEDIHKQLMHNIDQRTGFRKQDVRVIKSRFKSTPWQYVRSDIDILLKWYGKNRKNLHPLVLATLFHHKFEKIHPFMDGNGRAGRMLMNYILLTNKYPPIIIRKKNRKEYLDALRTADSAVLESNTPEHYGDLVQFTAYEFTDMYWNIFL